METFVPYASQQVEACQNLLQSLYQSFPSYSFVELVLSEDGKKVNFVVPIEVGRRYLRIMFAVSAVFQGLTSNLNVSKMNRNLQTRGPGG